jgi:hypothetical protein
MLWIAVGIASASTPLWFIKTHVPILSATVFFLLTVAEILMFLLLRWSYERIRLNSLANARKEASKDIKELIGEIPLLPARTVRHRLLPILARKTAAQWLFQLGGRGTGST